MTTSKSLYTPPDDTPATAARPHRPAVSRQAFLFVIIVVLSVMVLGAVYLTESYHKQFAEAGHDNAQLAYALSHHAEDTLVQVEVLSIGVLERLEVEGIEHLQIQRMNSLFKKQVATMPQLAGLYVYDKSGNWLSTDKDNYPPSANNSDREYFAYHQAHPDDHGLHIGPVIKSRSTGDLVIPVSRRINGPKGEFSGVFLATLSLIYFTRYYDQFISADSSVVILTLENGTLLARAPYVEAMIGQSLGKGKIFTDYLPWKKTGSVIVPSVLEKVDKLFSYRLSDRYPLLLAVGVTKSSLMKPWLIEATIATVTLLIMLIGLALLGRTLLRQISQVTQAENELQLAHSALQRSAIEDTLTGLFNRRHLEAMLPLELSRAQRHALHTGLIMVDVDHFKLFNDLYGHIAGDKCLYEVSAAIMASIHRPNDFAVRYGGEEIVIVLPDSTPTATFETASRIRNAVYALEIEHNESTFKRVTVSVGWSNLSPTENRLTSTKIFIDADQALYQAKEAGRNRVRPTIKKIPLPERQATTTRI